MALSQNNTTMFRPFAAFNCKKVSSISFVTLLAAADSNMSIMTQGLQLKTFESDAKLIVKNSFYNAENKGMSDLLKSKEYRNKSVPRNFKPETVVEHYDKSEPIEHYDTDDELVWPNSKYAIANKTEKAIVHSGQSHQPDDLQDRIREAENEVARLRLEKERNDAERIVRLNKHQSQRQNQRVRLLNGPETDSNTSPNSNGGTSYNSEGTTFSTDPQSSNSNSDHSTESTFSPVTELSDGDSSSNHNVNEYHGPDFDKESASIIELLQQILGKWETILVPLIKEYSKETDSTKWQQMAKVISRCKNDVSNNYIEFSESDKFVELNQIIQKQSYYFSPESYSRLSALQDRMRPIEAKISQLQKAFNDELSTHIGSAKYYAVFVPNYDNNKSTQSQSQTNTKKTKPGPRRNPDGQRRKNNLIQRRRDLKL